MKTEVNQNPLIYKTMFTQTITRMQKPNGLKPIPISVIKFRLPDIIETSYLVINAFPFIKWYIILPMLLLGKIYDRIYWNLNIFNENCERKFFVAKINGDFAGFVLTKKNRFYHDLWGLHLLCVTPKHRRKGVANKLINEVISCVKKQECKMLFLQVNDDNIPALNLYKKIGFKRVKKQKQYLYIKLDNR